MKIESKYILPICIKIHVPLQGIKSAPLKYQKVPCCKIPVFYLKGRKKPFKKSPCIPANVVAVAVFQIKLMRIGIKRDHATTIEYIPTRFHQNTL